jgi:Styrene monooxygenase A putative substrate binding domain
VDYRIYQPRLMEDFTSRGGQIEYRQVTADDLGELSDEYDSVVVCTGKGTMGAIFGRDESCSPYDKPQRQLCVGIFKGIREPEVRAVTMYFSPGSGEMIEIPTLTFNGMAAALVFENHPGGDLEILAKTRYDADPRAFLDLLLGKIRQHYPTLAERIDEDEFDLANGPLDILQGGVTPAVRCSHATLPNGKTVIALGDVHATVDPVLGQGANMASHAAWILGEQIVASDVFDERFVEHVDQQRNDRVLCATRWTNYMLENLRTLPEGLVQYIGALSGDRALSDLFTTNFNYPERQWDCFASRARTAEWLTEHASRTDSRPLVGADAS